MSDLNIISVIRPFTTSELADIYGVCDKTFRKWVKPHLSAIGERNGRYYSVMQVKTIIEKLGIPHKLIHA